MLTWFRVFATGARCAEVKWGRGSPFPTGVLGVPAGTFLCLHQRAAAGDIMLFGSSRVCEFVSVRASGTLTIF